MRRRRPGVLERVRRDRERGSVTLELAIVFPAVLLLLVVVVLAGRLQVATGAVENAAAAAAREASIARTADAARTAATATAADTLAQQGITCSPSTVAVDTTGFAVPVGRPAQVAVTIRCAIPLDDLAIPGLPGARVISADATSVLDRYRSR